MPKKKSRIHDEEGKETRERILRATIELMAEIGIDRVRTRGIAERAGVNPALIHYHFGSMSALVVEAAEDALLRELGPSLEAFRTGATIGDSITAIWNGSCVTGHRTPGSTILAEAMVKATRDTAFRKWTRAASRRFRLVILGRLRAAADVGELDPKLDVTAAAMLLAAALDGLLFHRLVDSNLDVMLAAGPMEAMLRPAQKVPPGARRKGVVR